MSVARMGSVSRQAKNGRAVFLLSIRSRFLRIARIWLMKSRGEKRLMRFSFIEYAKKSCALLGFSLLHKLSSAFIILYRNIYPIIGVRVPEVCGQRLYDSRA